MNTSAKNARKKPATTRVAVDEEPIALLLQLTEELGNRRISDGIARLRKHDNLFARLAPGQKNAGLLLGCLSQWVDVGFDRAQLVQDILTRFTKPSRATLPVREYIHLE